MKFERWLVILIVLATACNPRAIAQPPPPPTNTLVPVDALALYRPSLTTASQNDLTQPNHPTRYDLTLIYAPDSATLVGSQDVTFFNRQATPLSEVYFRLFANYPNTGNQPGSEQLTDLRLTVKQILVDGAAVTPKYTSQNTALQIPLAKPLGADASVKIHLEYNVKIPSIGRNRYGDFGASDSVISLPSVYPLIPAYDSKGWHLEVPPPYGDLVYADVSLYSVTMTVPSTMTVIASGSTIDTRDTPNGTKTWKIVGAPMRDFDINLTSQLKKSSALVGEITVNSWYEPADEASGKSALQFATDALRIFQSRFGAYPFRELDVVETPTSAGGIEYPGIVVIGRNLYKDSREKEFFEFATAHEVSHQWWYGVVGDDQVNFPWVDESLAQYSTLIYDEDLKGAKAGQDILKNYFAEVYNHAKAAGRDRAVNQPVSAFDEPNYGEIVYAKGPLFYDAIRKKMGDDLFFKFLRTYYERYHDKIAFPEDILKTAEDVCACNLNAEYQQWILSPAPK